jgi:translocation and assembly module TamB
MGLFKRTPPDRSNTPRWSKWKRRLWAAFLTLAATFILAPVLVARTPLRNWLLARAVPQLRGEIRIGGASLWWFGSPVFTDIELRDLDGRTILHVPRLEGDKSLLALLCHPLELGEFRLTRPAVHLVCSRDSSNLETTLAYWLQKRETPSDSGFALDGFALGVVLTQASLLVEDGESGQTWSLDPADATLAIPRDRRTPARFELNATTADAHRPGQLHIDLSARGIETNDAPLRLWADGELHAEELPLQAIEPLLRRFEPHLKVGGWVNADLQVHPNEGQTGAPDVRLEGSVSLQSLALSDSLLGPDVLHLTRIEAPCRLALEGTRLSLEKLEIQSEVGKASLAGTLDVSKGSRSAFLQPGHRFDAELNLARLAELVPNTLHLTKDTRIQTGTLSLHLRSSLRGETLLWEGDVHTSDLEGKYQGQHIVWKEPFALVLTAHQDATDPLPIFERFRCDSDFLRVEMSGTLTEWAARGNFNLGRLGEHLAGFVELGSLNVRGEGTVRASARSNPRGGYRLESDVRIAQFNLSDGARNWREDTITVRLDCTGGLDGGYRVNAGALHVLASNDGVDLDLLEPIADLQSFHTARVHLRVHGDLARWQGRVNSLSGLLEGVHPVGQIDVDSRLRYEAETIQLEDVKIVGKDVAMRAYGVNLNEPTLEFTTSGRWLPARDTLELQHTRLGCPTVTMQAPAVTLSVDRVGAWQITASASVQGDAARLRRCLIGGGTPESDTLGGALAGRVDLRPDEGRQIVQLDINVQNLALGSPLAPLWRESHVNLSGHVVYDAVKDSLRIVQLHWDSPTLNCDSSGEVAALSSDMELSLEGKFGYDLEKLEPQLRPYLGAGVKLIGRDVRAFHLSGPLSAPESSEIRKAPDGSVPNSSQAPPADRCTSLFGRLHGDMGLNWQSLQALGCQVGPSELRGQLNGGCFRTAPLETTLNQGRLHLEPTLRLAPTPLEVTLAKGRIIDRARLSPTTCAGALGYAVPVLAGVAQADGEISLDLQSCRIPPTEPSKADMVGWFTLHTAQVSAGPLVQELSVLLKGPPTLTLAKDNVVPFRLLNGRVYHTGLELHFPELKIRTSGSVGLDGSLALTAEMPVPPKWLGNSKIAKAAIGNQTIRLPIGGTLSKPKIDEQALRTASARFVHDAAENVLREETESKLKKETENGLRKLFRPRK